MARWQGAFPATLPAVRALRGEMAAIARECQLPEDRIQDVKLAVSEAATNVIVHAYDGNGDGQGRIRGSALIDGGELRIVIADDGGGMRPRVDSPGLGLGLPVISMLADSVEIVSEPGVGTEVRMTFPCPATA
jgi:serine/threonine-protein kinase RsbW/stage II sporulation protein AB (anti-sigma F factor)